VTIKYEAAKQRTQIKHLPIEREKRSESDRTNVSFDTVPIEILCTNHTTKGEQAQSSKRK
jgi:hypothetical protein